MCQNDGFFYWTAYSCQQVPAVCDFARQGILGSLTTRMLSYPLLGNVFPSGGGV